MLPGGHDTISVTPALIGCFDPERLIPVKFQVYDRLFGIRPDAAENLSSGLCGANGQVSVVEMELLAKVGGIKDGWACAYAQPAGFEHGILFVEAAAACDIYEQVAIFHPYIHADVSASAGHGLRGIRGGGCPNDVLLRLHIQRPKEDWYDETHSHVKVF